MESVITVQDLTKRFGGFTAVDGISFNVHRGEIYGFLGPNGSGKTTTIRMMLGLLEQTEGQIEVLGMMNGRNSQALRRRLGYMSQRFSLYNDLTVLQNLNFYGAAYGLDPDVLEDRIKQTIASSGLEGKEKIKTSELSGGWRQRLALGVAILHRPEILFLDEPTAGVDPVSRRDFWNLLYDLVKIGVTVFVTTHYMDEAEHCHRLGFILDGRLIAEGTPTEIKSSSFEGEVVEVFVDRQSQAVAALRNEFNLPGEQVELYGSSVHVVSKSSKMEKRIRRKLSGEDIQIKHLSKISPSLEDVFIYSIGDNRTSADRA
jgi:ABC-2 type transport system ATP-binding protein